MIPHEEGASGAGSSTEDEIMSASLEQGALGPESFDHEFKSHPDVFWPAARGEKTFEYRRDDRGGYEVGQTVRLRCYDPDHGYHGNPPLDRRITNILRGGEFELPQGYCILSLAPLSASAPASGAERMTAGEVDWRKVMRDLLREHDKHICLHEETHRGGAIWTICDHCGRKWADDEGGFQPYEEPAAVTAAWAALKCEEIATPAPATPPGVPDSLRALSELEEKFNASRKHALENADRAKPRDDLYDYYCGQLGQASAYFHAVRAVRALMAAQPAGQSAGQGAEDWLSIETAPKDGTRVDLWVVPHDAFANGNADRLEARWMERVGWVRIGGGYVSECGEPTHWRPRPGAPGKPAPDSTRTGDEGTEAGAKAVSGYEAWLANPGAIYRGSWLAAEQAAPEAQGAWQGIETAKKKSRPSIIVETEITAHGRTDKVEFIAHWAEDLSGEEQPAFRGWFYATGYGFAQLPGTPKRWRPLPAPPSSSGQGGR